MMGRAIGDILPLAIGIAISPIPIIAIILLLMTPKARQNGLAFLGGWLLGLAVVGTIVLVVANAMGVATLNGPSKTAAVLRLVLGLALLFLAYRNWTYRLAGAEHHMPSWMRALDHFTPGRAIAVGALLSGVNPKNLILTVTAATDIAQFALPGFQQAVVLVVLILVASVGIIAPVAVYYAMGEKSEAVLGEWREWLVANNATITFVLLLVFGVVLFGKGIAGLS
jgi:hypothetical protein